MILALLLFIVPVLLGVSIHLAIRQQRWRDEWF